MNTTDTLVRWDTGTQGGEDGECVVQSLGRQLDPRLSVASCDGGYLGLKVVMDERLAHFYSRHADELTRFATGLVGPSEAADVVGDAVTRLMRSRVWQQASNPRALLFRAVLYEARMFHRARRRRLSREARSAQREAFDMPQVEPEVAAAVVGLSPQQRAVVFLTYWDDLDAGAVAELLGVGEGTVRKQLGRARKRLREVLT